MDGEEMDADMRQRNPDSHEDERQSPGPGPLERARTTEILGRFLPHGQLDVLSVGGPGVYASWLADRGHAVELVHPIRRRITRSVESDPRIIVRLGDARALPIPTASVDAVLLHAPMRRFVEHHDRLRALAEAHRVLRAGGVVFAAGVSHHFILLDLLNASDTVDEPGAVEPIREIITNGRLEADDQPRITTTHLYRPIELAAEMAEAGFDDTRVLGIEGLCGLLNDLVERWEDPAQRTALSQIARSMEDDLQLVSASPHLMAVARRR